MVPSIRKSRLGPCNRLNPHPGSAGAPHYGAVLFCTIPKIPGETMNLTTEQLADLLIGITRAQNAIIEAMDRASPGFRSQHAVPILNVTANMRAGDPRMIDLPARILLRLAGRV